MLIIGVSIFLREFLERSTLFRTFIDKSFVSAHLIVPTIDPGVYGLFIDGLETGIIGSVLIISQLIFVMARLRARFWGFILSQDSILPFWTPGQMEIHQAKGLGVPGSSVQKPT